MPTQPPFGPLIDGPGRYDTLETWERFLAQMEALPPSIMRNAALESAKRTVLRKRKEAVQAGLSFDEG